MDIGAKILRSKIPEIMTSAFLQNMLDWHVGQIARYTKMQDYYLGNHAILLREPKDATKADNKEVNNYAKYITDVLKGYFIGNPITYSEKEGTTVFNDYIQEIFEYNDEEDKNSKLVENISIFGHSYELLWNDENADPRFTEVSPIEMFGIYDPDSIEDVMIAAIRYYTVENVDTKETSVNVEYYTNDSVEKWVMKGKDSTEYTQEGEETPHTFGKVPVVEYKNNDFRTGDFEGVISLIDSYNVFSSDCTNSIEDFVSAYLALTGVEGTNAEDIAKFREMGILLIPVDGKAEYITSQLDSLNQEFNRKRLKEDIHKFSMTPDMGDDNFGGTQSGVAMKFKLFTTEQVAITKERKFKKSLQQRIELLLLNHNTTFGRKEYLDVLITFSRNIPQNIKEIIEPLVKLTGIVSKETLLSQLPFKIDVKGEMLKIDAENKKLVGDYLVEE
ncbi:MAG: phage portal protein [Bacteroidetes bacterium]|nr:phage portal protein [Bacteroidota bacterium]